MTRKLIRTGNSKALTIDKTMQDHLDITDTVEVVYETGRIILRKPLTVTEAAERTIKEYGRALKRLAE